MERTLCYMAPVFHPNLGQTVAIVHVKKFSGKGKLKFEGTGIVERNIGTHLFIRLENPSPYADDIVSISAKDVYYGRHSLKLVGGTQIIKVSSKGELS